MKDHEHNQHAGERPYYQGKSGQHSLDVAEDFELNPAMATVLKYIIRYKKKGTPIEDMEKARWFIEREIKKLKAENDKIGNIRVHQQLQSDPLVDAK